jgi:nucleotide-binding universal stress UspA family protein
VIEFRQVLCPTDLSDESMRALTYAAAVARWYDATLTVLSVVPAFDPMPVPPASLDGTVQVVYPASREEVLDALRRVVKSAGVESLEPVLATEAGDPAGTIVDRAIAVPADLIVMGTHGRSGFERLMLGSVTEKVLRKAPCPVLTVPPHMTASAPAEVLFKRILCPVDFSPESLQALGFALDLARQADGTVTLLHVIEWLAEEEPRAYAHFNVPEFRQYLIQDARTQLHALVADEPQTFSTVVEKVTGGRAHREVLRLASELQPDLIVMGAQGRGGVGLALFGSTTQQVVRAAACPVLTVRGTATAPAG